jgi:hypothetical protein
MSITSAPTTAWADPLGNAATAAKSTSSTTSRM